MNWKLLRKIFGALLLVLGFLALLTPLTPGSWLIFVGAEILGIEMLSQERVKGYYQKLKGWWRGRRGEEEQKQKENI
ncbi:MAG: PGPGW domain-containing protein [bacterium]|nr:PGPGW domain-containing protein [bacterium]